jgi:hypothetical protein
MLCAHMEEQTEDQKRASIVLSASLYEVTSPIHEVSTFMT